MAKDFKYEKPLPVGTVDNYTLKPNPSWVGGAVISSYEVTTSGLTVLSDSTDGEVVQVTLQADVAARNSIHFKLILDDGRSVCVTGFIDSPEC